MKKSYVIALGLSLGLQFLTYGNTQNLYLTAGNGVFAGSLIIGLIELSDHVLPDMPLKFNHEKRIGDLTSRVYELEKEVGIRE